MRIFFFTPRRNGFSSSHALRYAGVVLKFPFEFVVEEGVLIFSGAGAEARPHLRVLGHVVSFSLAYFVIAV